MANVSFAKNPVTVVEPVLTPVEGVTIDVTTTSVPALAAEEAPAQTAAVIVRDIPQVPVVADKSDAYTFDDRNIGMEDIILPQINIVHKVGDLSEIFDAGQIVMNFARVIYSPAKGEQGTPAFRAADAPLSVTVLGFRKGRFVEKVTGGVKGALVKTEADVTAAGGTLDYGEWKASLNNPKPLRRFEHLETALLLVQKPEAVSDEDHVEFPYEHEGKFFAVVVWNMKGTAYTNGAKVFFTARKIGHLKGGYHGFAWSLSTRNEKYENGSVPVPVLKPAQKHSDSFKAFAREVLGV